MFEWEFRIKPLLNQNAPAKDCMPLFPTCTRDMLDFEEEIGKDCKQQDELNAFNKSQYCDCFNPNLG